MEITFSVPHVFHPTASQAEEAEALMLLMESLVAIDRAYLRHHPTKSLYRSGVVYGRTVTWDSVAEVLAKKHGDCKSLAAWRVAELRDRGVDCRPVFRWIRRRRSGAKDFHILVALDGPDGTIYEDPSKKLGMGGNENRWFG